MTPPMDDTNPLFKLSRDQIRLNLLSLLHENTPIFSEDEITSIRAVLNQPEIAAQVVALACQGESCGSSSASRSWDESDGSSGLDETP